MIQERHESVYYPLLNHLGEATLLTRNTFQAPDNYIWHMGGTAHFSAWRDMGLVGVGIFQPHHHEYRRTYPEPRYHAIPIAVWNEKAKIEQVVAQYLKLKKNPNLNLTAIHHSLRAAPDARTFAEIWGGTNWDYYNGRWHKQEGYWHPKWDMGIPPFTRYKRTAKKWGHCISPSSEALPPRILPQTTYLLTKVVPPTLVRSTSRGKTKRVPA